MKLARFIALALLFSGLLPVKPSYSIGEVFKVETSGTEFCGDFNASKFSAANNIDLWVQVVSDSELIVSLTPNFAAGTWFSMEGESYLTGSTSAAFVGGVLFEDGSYATIQGTAKADKTGAITSLAGTFIQFSVFRIGCFSSGKFKTVQRLS
jgi:hypothetical protein